MSGILPPISIMIGLEPPLFDVSSASIAMLAGDDTKEAAVDAHLIIFVSAATLFACNTNSLFPVNSSRTPSSASCPIEIAIFTAFYPKEAFLSFLTVSYSHL